VRRLTEATIELARDKFNLRNKLDNDMFNHILYVTNQSLLILKREGTSKDSLVRIGKMLWRLFRVTQAYNHKRRDVTLKEIVNVVGIFKETFGG
jgi:hypothetical protein